MAGPLHSDMQAMLDRRATLGLPGFADGTPEDARRSFAQSQAALPPNRGAAVDLIEDFTVAGPHGPVPVRRYVAREKAVTGLILYLHGGGWVFGTLDGFDPVCRELAHVSGAEVVSVDYRLAPEHRFPVPLDDAWAVLNTLGVGRRPLAVMGDSAGGNLAAALALRARDESGPQIDLQVLLYPVISPALDSGSVQQFGRGDYLVSRADLAWFWDHYASPSDRANAYAAPLNACSLTGLPEAIVVLAGCDPLHDEGIAYAEAMKDAGVPVTVRDNADVAHGFFTLVGLLDRADTEVAAVGALIADHFVNRPIPRSSA